MSKEQWTAVDRYLNELLVPPDAVLQAALAASAEAGLPPISVSPTQGKLLMMLAQIRGARSILEIGTLGGYSTIWLARGLAGEGRVITLESDERHAAVARSNIARAELSQRVEIIVGPAAESLPGLERDRRGPFDLVFIDADKSSMAEYFTWALRLSRPGSVIVADNVVRKGEIIHPDGDANVRGIRSFLERVAQEPRVTATAIQTVGSKGYDGLALALVLA
jgi:predicted O-methyltransferase YrrM